MATNKVLKRELIARGVDPDGRVLWKRDGTSFRMLTERAVSEAIDRPALAPAAPVTAYA